MQKTHDNVTDGTHAGLALKFYVETEFFCCNILVKSHFCYWLLGVYCLVTAANYSAAQCQRVITEKRDENDYS